MKTENGINWGGLPWLVLSLVVLGLDQWSKIYVSSALAYGESVPVFSWFNIVLVYNKGAAFSFLADAGGWQRWFFTIFTLVVSAALTYMLYKLEKHQKLIAVAYALIIGGALGNLYDRVMYGHVIDFIDWYAGSYHWPAFNIADSAIFLGVVLLFWDMIAEIREKKEK